MLNNVFKTLIAHRWKRVSITEGRRYVFHKPYAVSYWFYLRKSIETSTALQTSAANALLGLHGEPVNSRLQPVSLNPLISIYNRDIASF